MNPEKPKQPEERVMFGMNSLSEQLRDDLMSSMSKAKLKPGEDPAQSRQKRINEASLAMARYSLPGETAVQTEERLKSDAERMLTSEEERVAQVSGYLKMLVDFEKAFKEFGTERELRASPESSEKIKSLLEELGPILKKQIQDLEQGINLDERVDKLRADHGRKELAKTQDKLALLKKLAIAADLKF